jgi:hypothetical protein
MAIESPAHVKLDFFIAGLVVHDGASIKPVIAVQGRRG